MIAIAFHTAQAIGYTLGAWLILTVAALGLLFLRRIW